MASRDDGLLAQGTAQRRQAASSAVSLAFDFDLEGRALQLVLQKVEPAGGSGRRILSFDGDRIVETAAPAAPDCFYEGSVFDRDAERLIAGSYVSVTTCIHTASHAVDETVHGILSLGDVLLTISPATEQGDATSGTGVVHVTYPADAVRLGGAEQQAKMVTLSPQRPAVPLAADIWEGSDKETKLIELLLINDAARVAQLGEQVGADGLALIQNVNAIFAGSTITPRVRVVVSAQLDLQEDPFVWPSSGANEVSAGGSLDLLTAWAMQSELPHHDARLMLTRKDLQQSTVGVAYVGAMCSPAASLIAQTTANLGMVAATIVAHELGHSIGMSHDGVENSCPQSGFIMAAVAGPGEPAEPKFSSCSLEEFQTFLAGELGPDCMNDTPREVLVAACGDGAIGPGEQCDCGQTDCSELDPCCDGATCQLASGAECSNFNDPSACCVACKMALPDDEVICRPARDECDRAEKCTGLSLDCPGDAFEPGGQECSDQLGGGGVCFAGSCVSRGEQCTALGARFEQQFGAPGGACVAQGSCAEALCSMAGGGCVAIQGEQVVDGVACGMNGVCQGGACVSAAELDECPRDADKTQPGECGCGAKDTDTDLDLTPDCHDGCPEDADKVEAGACGCGAREVDGLGITVCGDTCPEDGAKTAPGRCGCGVAETDTDADGTPDCVDGCPTNPGKTAPDLDGCALVAAASGGGSGAGGGVTGQVGSGGAGPGAGGAATGGSVGAGGALGAGSLTSGAGGAATETGGGCSFPGRPGMSATWVWLLVLLAAGARRRRGAAATSSLQV